MCRGACAARAVGSGVSDRSAMRLLDLPRDFSQFGFSDPTRHFVRITTEEETTSGRALVDGVVVIPGLPVCRVRMKTDVDRVYRYGPGRAALIRVRPRGAPRGRGRRATLELRGSRRRASAVAFADRPTPISVADASRSTRRSRPARGAAPERTAPRHAHAAILPDHAERRQVAKRWTKPGAPDHGVDGFFGAVEPDDATAREPNWRSPDLAKPSRRAGLSQPGATCTICPSE